MTDRPQPTVSVLMPTYQQAAFLPRALYSLVAQTFRDWELVVVDDGSTDGTAEVLAAYRHLPLTHVRTPVNRGLGHALNTAVAHARGAYLAYLPSDDVYHPEHLESCVGLLEEDPSVHLAYAGVRWHPRVRVSTAVPEESATLRPDVSPGHEDAVLTAPRNATADLPVPSGNFLALVQVVHRRVDPPIRWTERHERVSDDLELEHWEAMLRRGCRFAHTGLVTSEWTDHPDQHHKIISGRGLRKSDWLNHHYGLSRYKQFYRVPADVPINWAPVSGGNPLDERVRYRGLWSGDGPTARDGLKILLAGSLGFNPERVLALAERGHRLYSLWAPDQPFWETAGPLPRGRIEDVPYDEHWRERVDAIGPDVIYGLLNWPALPFLHSVFEQRGSTPFVFHFKESPFTAMRAGYWPQLRDLVTRCAGRVFSSAEERDWFGTALGVDLGDRRTLVLDGDLPKRDWMTDRWSPRLSDADGEPHTVCVGRPFLDPLAGLASRGVHVHIYSHPYMRFGAKWNEAAAAVRSSRVHFHPPVHQADWVSELSRYDAGWLHVFSSRNGGRMQTANWDDLNIPARTATYALAGLPWILRQNSGHRVAVGALAEHYGVDIPYTDGDDLTKRLRRECEQREGATAMRRSRHEFTFDHHVDRFLSFVRGL